MPSTSHKRVSEARSTAYKRPRVDCLACYDSGILSDADGLLSDLVRDYDRLPDGRRFSGGDLAFVCHCSAAYPGIGKDGSQTRGGFRQSSGELLVVDSERGRQVVGSELSQDATRDLHRRRLERWKATEAQMSDARQSVADGHAVVLQAIQDARNIIRPVDTRPHPAAAPAPDPFAW